ncbi:MAG TPA: SDR family oxidoreductase [Gammaproteobacteria bacterium]
MAVGHALISGGSSGIGLALAQRLAHDGWSLSLLARDPGRLATAREALLAAGAARCETHAVDVADAAAAHAAVAAATAALGTPDRVILSAGLALPQYFERLEQDDFRRLMQVNYFGTLHVIRAALPAMRERKRGHLVLVSSGAGLVGLYGYAAYSPTKFAVRGLAEVLRAELRADGIGVSVVFPPDTDTPQLAAEERTKPAETRAIAGAAKVWSADAVARVTLRGVERGRFYITPGWEMTALGALHSLLRVPLQYWFDRLARRARPARG